MYHPVPLALSQAKMMNMAMGHPVQVAHHEMTHSPNVFHLTKVQLRKIACAYKAGKGCRLQLTREQLGHHMMHGSGFFSDALKHITTAANSDLGKLAIQAATPYAKQAASALGNKALGYARTKFGGNWFDDIMGPVTQIAHAAAPLLGAAMGARGGNWFDDIMGPVTQITHAAAPLLGAVMRGGDIYRGESFAPMTGCGLRKGSPEAKARMAHLRSMRQGKKSGSGLYQN